MYGDPDSAADMSEDWGDEGDSAPAPATVCLSGSSAHWNVQKDTFDVRVCFIHVDSLTLLVLCAYGVGLIARAWGAGRVG